MLKPQDIVLLCKLAGRDDQWTIAVIGEELGLSVSAVHRSLQRASEAHLYQPESRRVNSGALGELLIHSARYLYPAQLLGETRGVPTAWSAGPLVARFAPADDPPVVWAHPQGSARGNAVEPIHPGVPDAALRDAELYERLALVDALRVGGARMRREAGAALSSALKGGTED